MFSDFYFQRTLCLLKTYFNDVLTTFKNNMISIFSFTQLPERHVLGRQNIFKFQGMGLVTNFTKHNIDRIVSACSCFIFSSIFSRLIVILFYI